MAAGAAKSVRFDIPVAQLGFYDAELRYVVEAGEIEVLVGTSSADLVAVGARVADEGGGAVEKAFDGSLVAWQCAAPGGTGRPTPRQRSTT